MSKKKTESLFPMPTDLPTPENLFAMEEESGKGKPTEKKRRSLQDYEIPPYKVVRFTSAGLILALLLILAAAFAVNYFHIGFYAMESSSMERLIPKGSLVIVKATDAEEIQLDDLITYKNTEGKIITHQVVTLEESSEGHIPYFRTKGTENEVIDKDLVSPDQIKGKVIFYIPYIGKVFDWKIKIKEMLK